MEPLDQVAKSLRVLEHRMRRQAPPAGPFCELRAFPPELTDGHLEILPLRPDQVEAIDTATTALRADVGFEHLQSPEDVVWYFAAACALGADGADVESCLEANRREPYEAICLLPVLHLSVAGPCDVVGLRLLPSDDPSLPAVAAALVATGRVGSIAAVQVVGTDSRRMAERARAQANHGLRLLRTALRSRGTVHARQLRFLLGDAYAFDDQNNGWSAPADVAYDLQLRSELIDLVEQQPIAHLPCHPESDIERRADTALRWLERATLATDDQVELLFLFFALEALLGRKDAKLKGPDLAFRRMVLAHAVDGHFSSPDRTFLLYDEIRSAAVHGEEVQEGDRAEIDLLGRDVRRALEQYLTLARAQALSSRKALLRVLDDHDDADHARDWLRANGGPGWKRWLDQ